MSAQQLFMIPTTVLLMMFLARLAVPSRVGAAGLDEQGAPLDPPVNAEAIWVLRGGLRMVHAGN